MRNPAGPLGFDGRVHLLAFAPSDRRYSGLPAVWDNGEPTTIPNPQIAMPRINASGTEAPCDDACPLGRAPVSASGPARKVCGDCPACTYSADGRSCTACPVGKVSHPVSSSCYDCPVGKYASADGCGCAVCAAGHLATNGACNPCPAGTYSDESATVCTPCAKGSVSRAGAALCTKCPTGTFAKGGTVCELCPMVVTKVEEDACPGAQ